MLLTLTPLVGVDFDGDSGSAPENWLRVINASDLTINNIGDDTGEPSSIDLRIEFDGGVGRFEPFLPDTSVIPADFNPLDSIDGSFVNDTSITLTWQDLTPLGQYDMYVFGSNVLSNIQLVTITSASSTPLTYEQTYGDNGLVVNSEAGTNARTLMSYTQQVVADASGSIEIIIDAAGPGAVAAVSGVAIQSVEAVVYEPGIHGFKFEDFFADGRRDFGGEDVDGDGNLDVFEDLDGDGELEPNEDLNGDGFFNGVVTPALDEVADNVDWNGNGELEEFVSEDLNGDGIFQRGEDVDGDGKLDFVDEDLTGDGELARSDPGAMDFDIYLDLNENGMRDGTEPVVSTRSDGLFSFTGLEPGTYVVREDTDTLGGFATFPEDGKWVVTVEEGSVEAGINFGNYLGPRPGVLIGVDFDGIPITPAFWTRVENRSNHTEFNLIDEDNDPTIVDLDIVFASGHGGIDTLLAPEFVPWHRLDSEFSVQPYLLYLGGGFFHDSSVNFVWRDLSPGTAYDVYVFALDSLTTAQTVTISGAGIPVVFEQAGTPLYSNEVPIDAEEIALESTAVVVEANENGVITVNVARGEESQFLGVAGMAISPSLGGPTGERREEGVIKGRVINDIDGDGRIDRRAEDLDGDGNLDVDEDLNLDGLLNDGLTNPLLDEIADDVDYNGDGFIDGLVNEDVDGDGRLDFDEDLNHMGDGNLDVVEQGLEGWTIILGGGESRTTVTDATGRYRFEDVPGGSYIVRQELRGGWLPTRPPESQWSMLELPERGAILNFANHFVPSPSSLVGVDFDAATRESPINWTLVSDFSDHTVTGLITEAGDDSPWELHLTSDLGELGIDETTDPPAALVADHPNSLTQIGGNYFNETGATFTWRNLDPGVIYDLWVLSIDTFENIQNVAISGEGPPATFQQAFTDPESDELFINDTLSAGTQSFLDLAKSIAANANGEIVIRVNRADDSEFMGVAGLGINESGAKAGEIRGVKFNDLNADGVRVVPEDLDEDGNLDVEEDLDEDGNLDVAEDLNGDVLLNDGINNPLLDEVADAVDYNNDGDTEDLVNEDVDGDGRLDVNEDVDGDGRLDEREDFNLNDVLDAGEPGLEGWTIFLDTNQNGLLDAGEQTTKTDEEGNYRFFGVSPDDYTVAEVLQEDWHQSLPQLEPVDPEADPPPVVPATATHEVTVPSGGVVEGVEFGNFRFGEISGAVWNDVDADGVRDEDDLPLVDWTIFVEGTTISTQTDFNGEYKFDDLVPGVFAVREDLQDGFFQTSPTGSQWTVKLISGEVVEKRDFSNHRLKSAISGIKFNDLNGNGVQEFNEQGLQDWTIFIDANENGQFEPGEPAVQTDETGAYQFTTLEPDTYIIGEVVQPGWQQTAPADGTWIVDLALDEVVTGLDFANQFIPIAKSEIHGVKYHDIDGNGVRDPEEPGLSDWTIFLDTNNNGVFDGNEISTITDVDGNYAFLGLTGDIYNMTEVAQVGWKQTQPAESSHIIALGIEAIRTGIDFGNTRDTATISGLKFNDLNGDGQTDPGEPGLSGWTIFIDANDNGDLDDGETETVTDDAGFYSFSGLEPGTYILREQLQAGWVQSAPETGSFSIITDFGETITDVLFANFQFSEIGGTVFTDTDGNAVQDTDEPGLAGIKVYIEQDGEDGPTAGDLIATTAADGSYSIPQLGIGAQEVIVENDDPDNLGVSGPGGHVFVDLQGGQQETINFGFFTFASIVGTKFEDRDANGLFDVGELPLQDWTIFIDANGNGVLDDGERTSLTRAGGQFAFDKLAPGEYIIDEVVQEGWIQSAPEDGQFVVTVAAGDLVPSLLFGNHMLSLIQGRKWNDLNANGVLNEGEPGIADWTIFIDEDGNRVLDDGEISTVTDVDGNYSLDGLAPGTHIVVEDLQTGFVQTSPADGIHVVTLAVNETVTGIDFGNFAFGQISGVKFEDIDGNGVRDSREPKLQGWTVFIDDNGNGGLDENETSVVTDADGFYNFANLSPATYTIREVLQVGWGQSLPGEPDLGYTVTLSGGAGITGLDFGNYRFAQIHGLKWNDQNASGTFDEGGRALESVDLAPVGGVVLTRNDDNSTSLVNFGFAFEFYGRNYDQFYINNNGNITFDNPLGDFVPDGFPQGLPIVAPFWADVDTRNPDSAEVHLARGLSSRGNPFVQIDWPGVGYFDTQANLLNDFTLYIEDDSSGDIVAFVYDPLQWTTGDTEGQNGFGGSGVQIGFDSGDGTNFISLGRPSTNQQIAEFSNTQFIFRNGLDGVPQQETGTAGVTIYADLNENAQLDAGEPSTLTMDDNPLTNDVDETGMYWLTGFAPGTYTVREVVPDGFGQIFPVESDGYLVTLVSGQVVENQDFGNVKIGSISGRKFEDLNADGVQDASEPGLEGWTIFIDDNTNGVLDPGELFAVTDANGNYVIDNLLLGTYTVAAQPRPGWVQTMPSIGVYTISLGIDQSRAGVDFGNHQTADIRGAKFEDTNGNGVRDAGEPGLAGWTIFIDDNGNGILDDGETTTQTSLDGEYAFENLDPGSYTVAEVIPDGWVQSRPGQPTPFYVVTVDSGSIATDLDFGNFQIASISGSKWNDLNGDGQRDGTEPGLAGWTIYFDANGNGQLDWDELFAVTNAEGDYTIAGVSPGTHQVAEVLIDGWFQTLPLTGDHPVFVISGQQVAGIDFGNFKLGSISGTINGLIDPDGAEGPLPAEPEGIDDFVVFIDQNENGELDPDEPFQFTDADGNYRFDDLLPDTYTIAVQERPLWIAGGPIGLDPRTIDLAPGEDRTDVDDFLSIPIGPDLNGEIVSISLPNNIVPGDRGTIKLDMTNTGADNVSSVVGFDVFISHNQDLDEGDVLIGHSDQRIRLGPNQRRRIKLSFTVPQELEKGAYYVLVHADSANQLQESQDSNNVAASAALYSFSLQFGNVPGRRNVKLTINDANGTPVTFSLSGSRGEIFGGSNFDRVVLSGTSDRTRFKMATRGRGTETQITDLVAEGALGGILAGSTNLLGNVDVASVTKVQFKNVKGPSQFNISQWDGRRTVNMSFANVHDLSIDSRMPISMFKASEVVNTDAVTDVFKLPWFKNMRINRDFGNDILLTSTTVRQSIGKMKVGRWFTGATIQSPKDIGSLFFQGMRNATVYSGVRQDFVAGGAIGFPNSVDDFTQAQSSIKSVRIPGVADEAFAMINSKVAAWVMGRVRVGRVQTNNVTRHGFTAHSVKSYFRLRDEGFSPRTSHVTGPMAIDQLDNFEFKLV